MPKCRSFKMAKIHHLCGFHDFVAKVSRWLFVFCRCPAKRMSTKVAPLFEAGAWTWAGAGNSKAVLRRCWTNSRKKESNFEEKQNCRFFVWFENNKSRSNDNSAYSTRSNFTLFSPRQKATEWQLTISKIIFSA